VIQEYHLKSYFSGHTILLICAHTQIGEASIR